MRRIVVAWICFACSVALAGEKEKKNEEPRVWLKAPYPALYKGAPTDKMSVQYAAMHLCRSAGKEYDFPGSLKNCGRAAQKFVTLEIALTSFDKAMAALLTPEGLTWTEANGVVVLQLASEKPEEKTPAPEGEKKINELTGTKWKRIGEKNGFVEYSWKATVHNRKDIKTTAFVAVDFLDGEGMKLAGTQAQTVLSGNTKEDVTDTLLIEKEKADKIADAKFSLRVIRNIDAK